MSSEFEYRLSQDTNVLNGKALARVQYRRPGVRKWTRFLIVLDDEVTYESVVTGIEEILRAHEEAYT